MKKLMRVVMVACLMVFMPGCVSTDLQSARSQTRSMVTLSAEAYDLVMTSLGVLYKSGALGSNAEAVRAEAVKYANTYREAALMIAEGVDSATFGVQYTRMQNAIQKLKGLLNRLGVPNTGELVAPMERQMLAMAGGAL